MIKEIVPEMMAHSKKPTFNNLVVDEGNPSAWCPFHSNGLSKSTLVWLLKNRVSKEFIHNAETLTHKNQVKPSMDGKNHQKLPQVTLTGMDLHQQVHDLRVHSLFCKIWKTSLKIETLNDLLRCQWDGVDHVFYINKKKGVFCVLFNSSQFRDKVFRINYWFMRGSGICM